MTAEIYQSNRVWANTAEELRSALVKYFEDRAQSALVSAQRPGVSPEFQTTEMHLAGYLKATADMLRQLNIEAFGTRLTLDEAYKIQTGHMKVEEAAAYRHHVRNREVRTNPNMAAPYGGGDDSIVAAAALFTGRADTDSSSAPSYSSGSSDSSSSDGGSSSGE